MNLALLIVDVQQALCNGPWSAFDIENVIQRINALSARARAAGTPVVLIQHEEAEGPLQPDTDGWRLDERLALDAADLRIRKTACDAFLRTELQPLLQARGVEGVVVCGLQSEFCVDSTVRGALARGFAVQLVADGHSTLDNGVITAAQIIRHHNATLANLGNYGPGIQALAADELRF